MMNNGTKGNDGRANGTENEKKKQLKRRNNKETKQKENKANKENYRKSKGKNK
jgi:hypothetical protein